MFYILKTFRILQLVTPHIDVDSFIDWFIVEIAKSVDARWYSVFISPISLVRRLKWGQFDFDLSFGNVDYADAEYSYGFWVLSNPWINRLYQDPLFQEKVNTRFAYYYNSLPEIMAEIDAYALQIQWAQERNYTVWKP